MDHRWSTRTPFTLDVMVYRVRGSPHRVRAIDISIGGMFLQMDPEDVALNETLILVFTLHGNGEVSHHRLPASVMRVGSDGVGVMYDRFDRGTVKRLRRLLEGTSVYHPI